MSEFNWDEHPVVSPAKSFDWDKHPVVKDANVPKQKRLMDLARETSDNPLGSFSEPPHPEAIGSIIGGIGGTALGGAPGGIIGSGIGAYTANAAKNAYNHFSHPEEAPQTSSDYILNPLRAGADAVTGDIVGRKVFNTVAKGYKGLKNLNDNPVMRKIGKVAHGMQEDFTQRYLSRKGKLKARPADKIMESMQGHHDKSLGKITAQQEKIQNLKGNVQDNLGFFKDKKQEFQDQLANQKYNAQSSALEARQKLNEHSMLSKSALKDVNSRELVAPILESIEKLQENVIKGSARAYDILGNQQGMVNISPVKSELMAGMNKLKLNGEIVTKTDQLAYQELEKTLELINKIGDTVSFTDAKFLLQRLGHDTKWTPNIGAFEELANAIKQSARSALDQTVKNIVPAYRQQMLKVDQDTRLLKEVSKKFGTPELALSSLNNMSSPKGKYIDSELIKKLGQSTGYDFSSPINRYMSAKDILQSPDKFSKIIRSSNEHKNNERAQSEIRRLSGPAVKDAIRQRVRASNEFKNLNDSKAKLLNDQLSLDKYKELHEPYKPFSQQGVQARYKALNGARNFNAKKQFGALDKATGHNYSREVTDRAILEAFERTDTAGSRKTVFGKAIGKFVGMLIGGGVGHAAGGDIGAAAGVALGVTADKYSGQALRKLLDGRISLAQGTLALEKKFGNYAAPLAAAAEQGIIALSKLVFMLSQEDDFNNRLNGE